MAFSTSVAYGRGRGAVKLSPARRGFFLTSGGGGIIIAIDNQTVFQALFPVGRAVYGKLAGARKVPRLPKSMPETARLSVFEKENGSPFREAVRPGVPCPQLVPMPVLILTESKRAFLIRFLNLFQIHSSAKALSVGQRHGQRRLLFTGKEAPRWGASFFALRPVRRRRRCH